MPPRVPCARPGAGGPTATEGRVGRLSQDGGPIQKLDVADAVIRVGCVRLQHEPAGRLMKEEVGRKGKGVGAPGSDGDGARQSGRNPALPMPVVAPGQDGAVTGAVPASDTPRIHCDKVMVSPGASSPRAPDAMPHVTRVPSARSATLWA